MRTPLVLFLALVLLLPVALAQTAASPLAGKYDQVYVIAGRAMDTTGHPVSGGTVIIEIDQKGVKAEPLRAAANCKGDFITEFTLRHVDPAGTAKITLLGPDGTPNATSTVTFDPFFRRSDTILHLNGVWGNTCTKETDVWEVSASVSARLLNRTDPYTNGSETFYAKPYTGLVRLRFETPGGNTVCPPKPQSQDPNECEIFQPDDRGDIRYTFTLDHPFRAGGKVDLIMMDNTTLSVPIDPATRLGTKYFEMTGKGVPEELYKTPGLDVGLVLALGLGLALVVRRK